MLVCVFLCASCTRDRGCSAHPAFPAPSVSGDKLPAKLGRIAPRECGVISTPSLQASAKQSILFFGGEMDCVADACNDDVGLHSGSLKFESERGIVPRLARRPKPQSGEVRLRSRFARLRRTRIALSVLRGCAMRSPQGRSVVPLAESTLIDQAIDDTTNF